MVIVSHSHTHTHTHVQTITGTNVKKTQIYTKATYTMLAFHQWGFSSGRGERIPVPEETKHIGARVLVIKSNKTPPQ